MLPDRSKRFANTEDGDLPRLKLAENWQLAVIAFIMCGLFVVIFPRKALVEKLYTQQNLDELTLSYIENLHRTEPENVDLAILLGRARQERFDIAAMEKLLLPVIATGDARQRLAAQRLLLESYERAMKAAPAGAEGAARARLVALLETLRKEELPANWAKDLAFSAFRAEQAALGVDFLMRALKDSESFSGEAGVAVLVANAREALGRGRYALAAEYFLLARLHAASIEQARELFRQGIGALMAASLFEQAMQAADMSLGDLADDPATLRYLMRVALAAGDAQRAAAYARRLMFGEGAAGGGP